MKYSKEEYTITADYSQQIIRKRDVFTAVTKPKKAVHSIMITTDGIAHNEEYNEIQADITLNDLFEL